MDEQVKAPARKRQPQVRLENLDANTIRAISRKTGIPIPYLLREAVQLLGAKHAVKTNDVAPPA